MTTGGGGGANWLGNGLSPATVSIKRSQSYACAFRVNVERAGLVALTAAYVRSYEAKI